MTTEDIIYHLLYEIDNRMPALPKQRQAKLYPSELVTIGVFWAKRRTLPRLLPNVHQDWCEYFLAEPSFFTVIDSYPIELIFPIREGHSPQQVGAKSKDKGRWIVGIRLYFGDCKKECVNGSDMR
jgi:hypothetical protein